MSLSRGIRVISGPLASCSNASHAIDISDLTYDPLGQFAYAAGASAYLSGSTAGDVCLLNNNASKKLLFGVGTNSAPSMTISAARTNVLNSLSAYHVIDIRNGSDTVKSNYAYVTSPNEYLTGSTAGDMCLTNVDSSKKLMLGTGTSPLATLSTATTSIANRLSTRSLQTSVTPITANTNLDDTYCNVACAPPAATTITVYLPLSGTYTGIGYTLAKTNSGSGIVTISRSGGDTIDGSYTTYTLTNRHDRMRLVDYGLGVWYSF